MNESEALEAYSSGEMSFEELDSLCPGMFEIYEDE